MNCVIISLTYPFGIGDRFLKEEIPIIAEEFNHVYIIPLIKQEGKMDALPSNVEVILDKSKGFISIIKTIMRAKSLYSEVRFAQKIEKTEFSRIVYRAFMYEYRCQSTKKVLKKFDVDNCIFYSYWLSEPAYVLARIKTQNQRAFCISRAHGYDCFMDRGYNPYRREIAENIDYIYSISKKGKEDLERHLVGLARNNHRPKIRVSYLGVEYTNNDNPPQEDSNLFRIVSCSNILPVKRIDILMEAIYLVNCGSKRIEWIHFGGGTQLEQFREKSRYLNKTSNKHIRFIGETEHKKILQFYKENHIDLFINCSDSEGIPVSIMEAMGLGILCLARNVGGMAELIDDGETGWLLPEVSNAEMFARKIEEIMHSKENSLMCTNAKRKIMDCFTNTTNYHSFAKDIISNFKKR